MIHVEQLRISATGGLTGSRGEMFVYDDAAEPSAQDVKVTVTTADWTTPHLSSREDTVLARIWDNEEDDIFDTL